MATLLELRGLFSDSDLQDRVEAALIISAQGLLDAPTPPANDQKYAAQVFANPRAEARKALMSVLAANESATLAQIQGATDAAIKTNVDAVIADLVVAYNAGLV